MRVVAQKFLGFRATCLLPWVSSPLFHLFSLIISSFFLLGALSASFGNSCFGFLLQVSSTFQYSCTFYSEPRAAHLVIEFSSHVCSNIHVFSLPCSKQRAPHLFIHVSSPFRSEQMISDGTDPDVYKLLHVVSLVSVFLVDRSITTHFNTYLIGSKKESRFLDWGSCQCAHFSANSLVRSRRRDQLEP